VISSLDSFCSSIFLFSGDTYIYTLPTYALPLSMPPPITDEWTRSDDLTYDVGYTFTINLADSVD